MNLILALMGEILQGFAVQEQLWNKEVADKVAAMTETYFSTSGIRALFEKKRTQFCCLQKALLQLSSLGDRGHSDDNLDEDEFSVRVENFQLDAAKFSAIRNRTIANSLKGEFLTRAAITGKSLMKRSFACKAIGPPESPQRRQQMKVVLDDREGNQALFRSFEDAEWQEWFLTRKEVCCFVESLRGECEGGVGATVTRRRGCSILCSYRIYQVRTRRGRGEGRRCQRGKEARSGIHLCWLQQQAISLEDLHGLV